MDKHYNPTEMEPKLGVFWQEIGAYRFDLQSVDPVYSIDTPPPTVSGHLHLGHVYSYSHPDFMARFFRMNGMNVFYPMGFDDNGLPTERLVEKRHGVTVGQVGREAFIQKCLEVSEEAEKDYRALWQRLGLSIDWRYSYRTIDDYSRRTSQTSFLELYRQGRAYRQSAPTIWCPECRTAIAQAELNDLERDSEFVTLPFGLPDGGVLPVATTRPELLAACVAVFVNPEDPRYTPLVGRKVIVPLYGQEVPLLADAGADPQKGTGAVMCCTFGDQTDMTWWYTHRLPLVEAIDRDGRMTAQTGALAGLTIPVARKRVKELLEAERLILARQPVSQSIRVHERCDTPVEFVVSQQWFVRILDSKDDLLRAGEQIHWHPDHMQARYQAWVENLNWDWAISRQRTYGVPFPVWYCKACGSVVAADEAQLPVDPGSTQPAHPCVCGSLAFTPELDVMDTWATSSLSPQIVGRWHAQPELYERVYPFSLRPQAHEIIRTWAFYTIVKSHFHFGKIPWSEVLISGWGLAGEGMGKISKSRGGGPMAPMQMIERYSADALRYWAASTSPGKDSIISEEKIQMGGKLVTKLWNVARFSQTFLADKGRIECPPELTAADRWILAALQELVGRVTDAFRSYEYASAKNDIESFFWRALADNYLEMAKQRLYLPEHPGHLGACFALRTVLLTVLKLFAPILPYVTEAVYRELFAEGEGCTSIHRSRWPIVDPAWQDAQAVQTGEALIEIATTVRRYKSEKNLGLASAIMRVQLGASAPALRAALQMAVPDLMSVTRAEVVEVAESSERLTVTIQ